MECNVEWIDWVRIAQTSWRKEKNAINFKFVSLLKCREHCGFRVRKTPKLELKSHLPPTWGRAGNVGNRTDFPWAMIRDIVGCRRRRGSTWRRWRCSICRRRGPCGEPRSASSSSRFRTCTGLCSQNPIYAWRRSEERAARAWQISSYDFISLSFKSVKNRKLNSRFIFPRTVFCWRGLFHSDKFWHFL